MILGWSILPRRRGHSSFLQDASPRLLPKIIGKFRFVPLSFLNDRQPAEPPAAASSPLRCCDRGRSRSLFPSLLIRRLFCLSTHPYPYSWPSCRINILCVFSNIFSGGPFCPVDAFGFPAEFISAVPSKGYWEIAFCPAVVLPLRSILPRSLLYV